MNIQTQQLRAQHRDPVRVPEEALERLDRVRDAAIKMSALITQADDLLKDYPVLAPQIDAILATIGGGYK